MKTSVDISYYPLKKEFIPSILDFIHRLKSYDNIKLETGSMSTQVFGEYDEVMEIITKEMKKSMDIPYSVFVLKVVNLDMQINDNRFIDE